MTYIIRKGTSTPEQSPWYRPWVMGDYIITRIFPNMAYQTQVQQTLGDNSNIFDEANIWVGRKFQAGTPWSWNNLTLRWLPSPSDPYTINLYGALERAQDGRKLMYSIGTINARLRESFDVEFINLKATRMFQITVFAMDGSQIGNAKLPKVGLDGWIKYGILPRFNDLGGKAPQDLPFALSS